MSTSLAKWEIGSYETSLLTIIRLYSDIPPENPALRLRLINTYFERIHPLRCLAFIHKPSFMHALSRDFAIQDYSKPLLYVMCALGARLVIIPTE